MKIGRFINRDKIEEQNHREQKIPENKEKDIQKNIEKRQMTDGQKETES